MGRAVIEARLRCKRFEAPRAKRLPSGAQKTPSAILSIAWFTRCWLRFAGRELYGGRPRVFSVFPQQHCHSWR